MMETTTKEKNGKILVTTLGLIGAVIVLAIIVAFEFDRHKVYSIGSYISVGSITLTIILFIIKGAKEKITSKEAKILKDKEIKEFKNLNVELKEAKEQLKELEGIKKQLKSLEELKGLNIEFNNFKELFDSTNKKLIEIQVQDRKPILGLKLIKFGELTGIYAIDERPKNKRNVWNNNAINKIPVIIEIQNKNQQFNIDIKKVIIKQLGFENTLKEYYYPNYETIHSNGGFRFDFSCYSDDNSNIHNFEVEISFNESVYNYNLLFTFSFSVIDSVSVVFYNPLYTVKPLLVV